MQIGPGGALATVHFARQMVGKVVAHDRAKTLPTRVPYRRIFLRMQDRRHDSRVTVSR
jgi:hypothetical protein